MSQTRGDMFEAQLVTRRIRPSFAYCMKRHKWQGPDAYRRSFLKDLWLDAQKDIRFVIAKILNGFYFKRLILYPLQGIDPARTFYFADYGAWPEDPEHYGECPANHDLTERVDTTSPTGNTALMGAAYYGDLALLKRLLAKGVEVDAKEVAGNTALKMACERGHLQIVEELLIAGADVNATDKGSGTPLMRAAAIGRADIVDRLIKAHANVNATNDKGNTALMAAALSGVATVVRSLIAAEANVQAANLSAETASDWAKHKGHNSAIAVVIDEAVARRTASTTVDDGSR